jgi:predicted outer membrane repeat protein
VENLLVENNVADSDNNHNGNGGGINFTGAQSWTLPNTTIVSNTAAFGGGISVTAGTLTLDTNTLVEGNIATGDGGGINVDGRGRLIAAKPQTLVYFNHAANGRGGGINLSGARADIGSPGFSGVPVVYMNDAVRGGGIAAVAGANPASVRLFTTDATQPVSIIANSALDGGGIYLQQLLVPSPAVQTQGSAPTISN